jgi:hypothetical protein
MTGCCGVVYRELENRSGGARTGAIPDTTPACGGRASCANRIGIKFYYGLLRSQEKERVPGPPGPLLGWTAPRGIAKRAKVWLLKVKQRSRPDGI